MQMDKWKNSVVIVTSGNSGVGLSILKHLAQCGLKVVGFDTQLDAIDKLKVEFKHAKIYSWHCDATKDDVTEAAFNWVEKNIGPVDVLINCAGQHKTNICVLDQQKSMSDIVKYIDVNYTAVLRCTRLAFKSMEAQNSYGYIITINSLCEHSISSIDGAQLGMDASLKAALKTTSDVMRFELNRMRNRKIRITTISPGVCNQNASDDIDNSSFNNPTIKPEHIGDIVTYLLKTPNEITITDLQITPTGCCTDLL